MLKKILNAIKKCWKFIVIGVSFLITAIAGILAVAFIKEKRQEKKKRDLIKKNDKAIEKAKKRKVKHEKDIHNSNANYNDLISGRKRKGLKDT